MFLDINLPQEGCVDFSQSELPVWAPVEPEEVSQLIGHLKSKKAPGIDAIPPELLKNDPDWWAR